MTDDMGVIATNEREIKLFYNAETNKGMQTLAYLKSSQKKVLDIDLSKTKVTGTQWTELAKLLGKPIKDLINTEHPDFIKKYGENPELPDDEDWLKLMENNPKVVTQPILVNGDQAVQIDTPSEVMQFIEDED
ncbi:MULTISPECIES: arsenate reductase family protein [unclassified Allomuricauda]|uniref:arsenate reductase family protein n=2 Tax=unclassified Allomuricauda TaxID=2615049 RepID=UPI00273F5DBD|nr:MULTISPECIES: ArsC/Spx/MgsR family protein [unclassified Allomuricauda]